MTADEKPKSRVDALARQLRKMATKCAPGQRMPSYRSLMREFGVSQTTVAAALRRLEEEGVTETKLGSGVYVARDAKRNPVLLLCDSASFVNASPFWEMLLEGVIRPYSTRPDDLVAEFTVPNLGPREEISLSRIISSGLWSKLQARQFAGVIAVCVDERLVWEFERLGIPVVGFGCPAHYMVRLAVVEACQMGVQSLVELGCKRIALYNAPHITVREVFLGALAMHGASECIVPPKMGFQVRGAQLGYRSRLVESGINEARRLFGPGSDPSAKPDGIVSVDDMFTQGFLIGLGLYGILPGRDIEIATHENLNSPILSPWSKDIVAMEFNVSSISTALTAGIESISVGKTPNRGGWEESLLLNERQGPLRTLTIRPKLRPKSEL